MSEGSAISGSGMNSVINTPPSSTRQTPQTGTTSSGGSRKAAVIRGGRSTSPFVDPLTPDDRRGNGGAGVELTFEPGSSRPPRPTTQSNSRVGSAPALSYGASASEATAPGPYQRSTTPSQSPARSWWEDHNVGRGESWWEVKRCWEEGRGRWNLRWEEVSGRVVERLPDLSETSCAYS